MSRRTPDSLRHEALEAVRSALGVDVCTWFMVVPTDAGLRYGRCVAAGATPDRDHFGALTGAPLVRGTFAVAGDKPWLRHEMNLRRSPQKVRNRFRSFAQEVADMAHMRSTAVWELFYVPIDAIDQTRMLAYADDGSFLGWFGAVGRRPIDPARLRALGQGSGIGTRSLETRVHAALQEAHDIEVARSIELPQPNSFVCTSGGEVVAAGLEIVDWCEGNRRALADACAAADARGGRRIHLQIGRAAVRGHRLRHTESGDALWACHTTELPPPALSPLASLSPRQHEVATYAAAGATNPEIAAALECSLGTVKSHLEAVYRKLEIESRVELASQVELANRVSNLAGGRGEA